MQPSAPQFARAHKGKFMDQEKDKNPIAEIFDEMFTLLEDLETRSVATLDYLQGQQGVTDENLAPYLDRAAAASEVRWRAARARMEHLLAPKPQSSTEAANDAKGKDEKPKAASQDQPQAKGNKPESGAPKTQSEKEKSKPESNDLGKELASAQPGAEKSGEERDTKSQNPKPPAEKKPPQNQQNDPQKGKDAEAKPKESEAQASALVGGNKSDTQKSEAAKAQSPKSDASENPKNQSTNEENQTQKAAK
ncbi:MAG TPA: hypothetical protein VGJ06_01310 [Candidatus Acidoferrum sp.]